jgi:hypothetical protein
MWKARAGAKWNPHRARLEAVQWRVIGTVVAQAEEGLSKAHFRFWHFSVLMPALADVCSSG